MPSPAPKRRKTCKLRREDSSDDDVLYVGTSPGHKQQQKPQKKEVIQLDSSDGSRFSLSGLTSGGKHKQSFDDKTTIKVAREPRTKKRDRSYNEVEEVVDRRKDPPEYLTVARAGAKDTLHRSKWPPAGDDGLSNNLRHVAPVKNMPIEIRDNDFIWSSAKIHKVSNPDSKNCRVTIRYEGWGSEWDEVLPYPSPRLARIFTYTKRVKCLGNVLSKKKEVRGSATSFTVASNSIRNWSDVWPCTVSYRMPHPGLRDEKHMSPEDLLRLENNIFVQPYAPHLLSSFLQKGLMQGGWWITTSHLRLWKDFDVENPLSNNSSGVVLREMSSSESATSQLEYHFPKDFIEAYKVAKSDKWVRGYLPSKTITEGTLVDEKYRVQNVGGDAFGGVKYTGAFDMRNVLKKRASDLSSHSPSPVPPSKEENVKSTSSIPESSSLPRPIFVNYQQPGVRLLANNNRWASVVKIAGNDVFLGSFASQTEAVRARELALAQYKGGNTTSAISDNASKLPAKSSTVHHSVAAVEVGPINDLSSIPVEAVISAFEQSNTKMSSFSLQNVVDEKLGSDFANESFLFVPGANKIKNKRKQKTPKRRPMN